MRATPILSIILLPVLAFPQQNVPTERVLSVSVLEGEGAFNNVRKRTGRNIRVQVRDGSGNPVAGATVKFIAPVVGPGVEFGSSGNTYQTTTDTQGEAATVQAVPNSIEGRFMIRVAAEDGAQTATARVIQSNTTAGGIEPPSEGGGKRKLIMWLAIGGAAAVGTAFAFRSNSSTPAIPPPTLSIGPITVGGPR